MPPHRGQRSDLDQRVLALADGTRTYAEIATALGMAIRTIHMSACRLRGAGENPKFRRKAGRGYADNTRDTYPIVEALVNGESPDSIASQLGRSREYVYSVAARAGLQIKQVRRNPRAARNLAIAAAHQAGERTPDLARRYNVSKQRINQILLRHRQETR